MPTIFCGAFLIAGIAILAYLPVRKGYQYLNALSWVETPAHVVAAKLVYGHLTWRERDRVTGYKIPSRTVRKKRAYKATGKYTYSYDGSTYTGHRLTLSDGLSTDRGPHEKLVSVLQSHKRRNVPITAYVNPGRPDQSVIVRTADWLGIIIGAVLGLVLTSIGGGMLWFLRRT